MLTRYDPPMEADITIGGIRLQRDIRGNLVITCRGNGQAHVQRADVPDLRAVLDELARIDGQKGDSNGR